MKFISDFILIIWARELDDDDDEALAGSTSACNLRDSLKAERAIRIVAEAKVALLEGQLQAFGVTPAKFVADTCDADNDDSDVDDDDDDE